MINKDLDVIICTCVYNRTHTLPTYLESLLKTTNRKFHIAMVVNYDEQWPLEQAEVETHDAMKDFLDSLQNRISFMPMPNTSLMGYNFGLEMGRIFDKPVLCCNDDIIFGEKWCDELLREGITRVSRLTKAVDINPDTVGCIGPVYVEAGCMLHQKYHPDNHGYVNVDYVVGHAQLITRQALRKGFTYDPKICTKFGAYDIYQSMWMCANDLNVLVCHDTCFNFPESKESHFHNGSPERFRDLDGPWKEMQRNLEDYQRGHISKHGYNKWFE